MRFDELNLIEPLLRAVQTEGYTEPTPIQQQAIPHVLEGRDLLGCAQTGTGKTAAFALPILQRLANGQRPAGAPPIAARPGSRPIRVLILTPTRELASQISESFSNYGRHTGLRNAVIFGGVGQDAQIRALRSGLDVLIATPGRLLDLMQQGFVHLKDLEVFVLDEADRMLDMGFIHDVRRVIAALPRVRQTLFFSATMPDEIQRLADSILTEPVRVAVTPVSSTAERIDQSVFFVEKGDKRALLEHLLRDKAIARVLVFSRTKHGANRIAEQLAKVNIRAEAIHGNKSQNARERALANFKSGTTRVLVATDIAARGIDIDGITHVINYDLPNVPESYVHRIGRTARAGAEGVALSFCDGEEREFLVDIERLIRLPVPVVHDHPYRSSQPAPAPYDPDAPRRRAGTSPAPRPSGGGQHHHGGGSGGGGGGGRRQGPPSHPRAGYAAPRPAGNGGGGHAAPKPAGHGAAPHHAGASSGPPSTSSLHRTGGGSAPAPHRSGPAPGAPAPRQPRFPR